MRPKDLVRETLRTLAMNSVRSGLTILGIVVGIASVIVMVAMGQGAQNSIKSSIEAAGSNLVTIVPGAPEGSTSSVKSERGTGQSLTAGDAEALAGLPGIAGIAPELTLRYQARAAGTNVNSPVVGTLASYAAVRNITMAAGTFLSDENASACPRVAVLGPTTRDDLFGAGADALGKRVRLGGTEFTVIGVTSPKGGEGPRSPDIFIYVPLSTAQRYLARATYVTQVNVRAVDSESLAGVQEAATSLLLERHGIADPVAADFTVVNQASIVQAASSVADTFTLFLGSIAGISLLVGGIGIMNMMLTTVIERTREIGLRKAVGACSRDIKAQFLAEAVMLTCIGGVVGIAMGWVISEGVARFAAVSTSVSPPSVVLAFAVCAGVGVAFGYYPARRAAALSPIEALRYQ